MSLIALAQRGFRQAIDTLTDDAIEMPTATVVVEWPAFFINRETGREYRPHHEDERLYVYEDSPRYALAKGGEGGGKSVAATIKTLNRLRRGMTGIMVGPDFEHFKKSSWPEFRRWCPVEVVIERQRYRLDHTWEPQKSFALHFYSEDGGLSTLYCGGIEDPTGWEGPNVNFAHFDEARRHNDPLALKVLDGRVRIPGPKGEPPQLYMSTTPRKHWLFDYFGPVHENDPLAQFKANARVITLLTVDNERAGNLSAGFTENRGMSLTESERRVLLEAEWEDTDEATRFLTSMIWWDACCEKLPPLDRSTPLACAADGAVSGDTFGLLAVSLHPADATRIAVRHVRAWEPRGKPLDFDEIEKEIRDFCRAFNVRTLAYDPYQLHQMMTRLRKDSVVNTEPFNQGVDRLVADKQLLDLITKKVIAHDGDPKLRQHVDNADKKVDQDRKMRIVKRTQSLKIDLTVSLSMAVATLLKKPKPASSGRTVGM